MTTPFRPSLALRPQRDSLRLKPLPGARNRAAGHALHAAGHGSASDSVFKRLPAIGEVPATPAHG